MMRLGKTAAVVTFGALASTVLALTPGVAQAAVLKAYVIPSTGNNIDTQSVSLDGGCPADTANYTALMFGQGFKPEGQLAKTPTQVGISTGPFTYQLSNSFQDIATAAGVPTLQGQYTIRTQCQDEFSNLIGDQYVATLTFNTPTAYTAEVKATQTATTLAVSPASPVSRGTSVTLTATVGGGATGGTVTFKDGTTNLGAPVALTGGTATLRTTALPVGTRSLTAVYSGATTFAGSTSAATSYVVNAPAATTTTLAVTPASPVTVGTSVTLNATVPGATGGTVQFRDGTTNLGAPVALTSGAASRVTTALPAGTRSLNAVYSGAPGFAGSTSASVSYVVNPRPVTATTTTLTVSPAGPVVKGTNVTLTAAVSGGPMAGAVQFKDGTANLGPAIAVSSSGAATYSTTALPVGTRSLTAVYSGAPGFATSTSPARSLVVNPAPTPTPAPAPTARPSIRISPSYALIKYGSRVRGSARVVTSDGGVVAGARTLYYTKNKGVTQYRVSRDLVADETGLTEPRFLPPVDYRWFVRYRNGANVTAAESVGGLVQVRR